MKSYVKGIITGIILTVCVGLIPVIGDTIDVLFNQVRININGIDKAQWGENYTLDNGETVPYSILYKGTTYLPLRKIGEFTNKQVCWNGDTQTATLVDTPRNTNILAEKPDKNGNVWTYYTFETADKKCYLGVKDEKRGYERVYQLIDDAVKVTDDKIYFMRVDEPFYPGKMRNASLVCIDFANNADSQDGTILHNNQNLGFVSTPIFDGDYIYYLNHLPGNATHYRLIAYNYITKSYAWHSFKTWYSVDKFDVAEITDTSATFDFVLLGSGFLGGNITYDKTTNTFSQSPLVEIPYPQQ